MKPDFNAVQLIDSSAGADYQRCFEEAMRLIDGAMPAPHAAGFRDLEEEDYVRLWPKDDTTPFELK